MSIACSTSAFKMPLDDALGEVKRLGFDCVDLICIKGFGHIIPSELAEGFDAYAAGVEAMLAKHGLTPVAGNMAVANPYQRDDAEVNAQRLKEVDAVARLMKRLGVGVVSFFPGGNWPAQEMDWNDVLQGEVETVREMIRAAAKHDVTLVIEPHANTPFEKLEQIRALLEAVPELGVAYDPSHFALQEIDLKETAFILDRTTHLHMRDAAPGKMTERCGKGTIDFKWIVESLKQRGYAGHCSVEYLPPAEGEAPYDDDLVAVRDTLVGVGWPNES